MRKATSRVQKWSDEVLVALSKNPVGLGRRDLAATILGADVNSLDIDHPKWKWLLKAPLSRLRNSGEIVLVGRTTNAVYRLPQHATKSEVQPSALERRRERRTKVSLRERALGFAEEHGLSAAAAFALLDLLEEVGGER